MREITIDLKNYNANGSVFRRTAARGIIERNGKYLIIHSKYGDYKFPGGGKDEGETLVETLIREVQEETGYKVIPESISEYVKANEKRKGDPDDMMIMESYYYLCQVEEEAGNRNLDDYEEEYDYQVVWMTLEEAIRGNELVDDLNNLPWVLRELVVMKEIVEKG